ncbi:hypothetical protein DFH08DRAFT_722734, partial [Mycena albidolilacea]
YPMYMTIGNIPKEIRGKPSRRAHVLLAYPPRSRLNHIKSDASRCSTLGNLFNACLTHIRAPLREAGIHGLRIASSDGKNPTWAPEHGMLRWRFIPLDVLYQCIPHLCPHSSWPAGRTGK